MSDVRDLEIRDSDGSSLRFRVLRRTGYELYYLVAVDVGWARATAEVSTYEYGPPVRFFASLAESWRGWDGALKWEDLEQRLGFTATCDRTGHVALDVVMNDSRYTDRVQVRLYLEAGALEGIAHRVASFFAAAEVIPLEP